MAKKRNGKKMLLLLVLILLIVIVLFLLFHSGMLGLGNGFGTDSGNEDYAEADQSISDTLENTVSDLETGELAVTEPVSEIVTETEMLLFDITVMGSIYLYQNQETGLEDLLSEMQSQENYYMVRITDDNATQNAMEDLLNVLQESEITYALN